MVIVGIVRVEVRVIVVMVIERGAVNEATAAAVGLEVLLFIKGMIAIGAMFQWFDQVDLLPQSHRATGERRKYWI